MITVGEPDGTDQPTVSIGRVTITGGFNGSTPLPFAAWRRCVDSVRSRQRDRGNGDDLGQRHHRETGPTPQATDPFCGLPFAFGGGIFNAGR